MSLQPKPGAVVYAKNMSRVARFYEEVLSMSVAHSESDHVVLESSGFELVVHAIPKRIADSFQIATPPERREETPIKLFFHVASIEGIRSRVAALGGELNPASRAWEARDFRACDGHDPEGNVVQFRENLA
jgi:predicted enzyme related to lactoylglutathione lyase